MHWVSSHSGKLLTSATKQDSSSHRTFSTHLSVWDKIAPEKGLARGAIHELLHKPDDPAPVFVSAVMALLATDQRSGMRDEKRDRRNKDVFLRSPGCKSGADVGNTSDAMAPDWHPELRGEVASSGLQLDMNKNANNRTQMNADGKLFYPRSSAFIRGYSNLCPSVDGSTELAEVHLWQIHSPIAICDPQKQIYPPALAAMGVSLNRVYLIHPKSPADELWAMTESLRCKGVGATIASPGRLDRTQARRLQLAAEQGGGIGIFLRPLDRNAEIYSAITRWLVTPVPGERVVQQWRIQLLHGHGGQVGKSFILERNRETHLVRATAELSHRPLETNVRLA